MKTRIYPLLSALVVVLATMVNPALAQTVLDPTDVVKNYDSTNKPAQPAFGSIGKWVRTPRLNWNTDSFKCYFYKGRAFRLRFPKSYQPGVSDGKKYPMLIFFHGAGEGAPTVYDNEQQLFHGGDLFTAAVSNGTWDGYVLAMQTTGGWGTTEYGYIKEIIDYMAANNKLDPFHVVDNGLSAGGQGTWEMYTTYPTYIAGLVPMSGVYSAYTNPGFVNNVKFTLIWNLHGGQDGSPAPFTAAEVLAAMQAQGANYVDKDYTTLGHDTWDSTWQEPNFWPFLKTAYMSNPWTLFGRTQFCPGDPINVTVGLVAGFDGYQWRKNGTIISGATSNTINVTSLGTYDARVLNGSTWSDWSHTPVVISIKAPTVTPNITVAGLMSKVIPAADDNTSVRIKVPSGYISYLWQQVGSNTTIGTDSILVASTPGKYIAKVTEQFGCSSSFSTPFTVIDANGPNKPDPAAQLAITTISKTALELDWSQNPHPTNNETNFEIYRATKSGGPYRLVAITPADAVTYTDSNLLSNIKYFYTIRAIDGTSASVLSNEAAGNTARDTQAPTAPSNLTLTAVTRNSIGLSWGTSTDDVSVTGYDIYVNGVKNFTTTATQFTINSLSTTQLYTIVVKAEDPSGNLSIASNQVAAVTVLKGLNYSYYNGSFNTVPDFSTLTPAAAGNMPNISLAPQTQSTNFAFYWYGFINIPVAGTYTFQTSSDDGSNLYLGPLNGNASPYSFTAAKTVSNDGLHGTATASSADLTLAAGIYPIAITFFQQGGGAVMNIAWKTPQTGGNFVAIPDSVLGDKPVVLGAAPAIPTGTHVSAISYNSVNVAWTDNSTNESGFEIYRAGSGTAFNIIATTGPNVTSYIDSVGLQPSSTYYYKVRAINQYGGSSFDSASLGGLSWALYPGAFNSLPNFSTLTPASTGTINNISLSPAAPLTTNYALTFKGTIQIPTTGTYTFYTSSDDGSKLYVSGNQVVNNNFLQGNTERSGTLTLNAGTYPLEVDFFQATGGQILTASYAGPDISKRLIPDAAFVNPNTSATTLALPAAPAIPSGLAFQALTPSEIGLSWSDTSASGITGFNVYRSTGDSARFLLISQLAPAVTNYTDTGLFAGQTYYYKVNAAWVGGNTGYSATVSGMTAPVAPVLSNLPEEAIHYGTTVTFPLTATSASGGTISFSAPNLPAFGHLTDNGDGTASLNFSPAVTDQGVYSNLMVIAKTIQGGADTTTFTLTVNDNYIPIMDTIVNYTISENDSLSIPLHAADLNAGDTLNWSASGLPAGYMLTNVNNGSATLLIHPGYAAAGTYTVQVTVNDGKGGVTTRSFGLVVNDKTPPTTMIHMRFKNSATAPAPWNNITGLATTGLLSDSGATTPVGLQFQGNWFSTFNSSVTTGNNSGVYPDVVLNEDYFFGVYPGAFSGPNSVTAAIIGLDTTHRYTLSFYAGSNWGVQANNGITTFTVADSTIPIAVQNNTQNLVTFNNLKAAADGTIHFTASTGANTLVGYINAIVLSSVYDDGTAPAAPASLTARDVPGQGAQLSWTDIAYNESGYEIYRTTDTTIAAAVVGQAGANATSYTDTTAVGNTLYYYKVHAVNANGTSSFSNTAAVATSGKAPKITSIANVVLRNDQQTTVTVTATDDPGDHVTLSVANLPAFATFTDNGDGTGSIAINPNGSIGTFAGVTVTATDNSDSSRSASFDISVVDKNVSSTYVMFSGGAVGPKPWNSFVNAPFAGATLTNLVDDGGGSTGMTVTLVDGFQWFIATGMRPNNGMTVYPEPVIRNGFYESSSATHTVRISGLSASKRYNFVFFNSHDDGFKCLTNFTINDQAVSLNATYNINKTVQINGITPDASGNVTITVTKASGQDYAFLTTMVIQTYDPATAGLLSPSDLRVINTARTAVTLQWADRATGETGMEVWRSSSSAGGSYSLLATLPANTTNYTDTALSANTTYYYTIRAIQPGANSDYSGAVTATTLASQIYIDFNNNTLSPMPWNNTNSIPQQGFVWNNLHDELGLPVNAGMTITKNFDGLYSAGVQTGNTTGIYPDNVLFDSYGLFPGDSATLKITGLNLAQVYNFTFFGSTIVWGDVNTSYTVNGHTTLLNTSVNSTGTVTLYGVQPDANGEVTIGVAPGTSTSQFGLLGAMIIGEFNGPTSGQAPAPPTTPASTRDVQGMRALSASLMQTDSVGSVGELKAFPNPFTQSFTLVVPARAGENVQVQIYDLSGRLVYMNQFSNLNNGDNYLPIQTGRSFATTGVYMVRVVYPEKGILRNKTIKLMRQ